MPAFCQRDAYDVYYDWCHDIGRVPPSRDWWEAHRSPKPGINIGLPGHDLCRQKRLQASQNALDTDFDVETEQRCGWAYGERIA